MLVVARRRPDLKTTCGQAYRITSTLINFTSSRLIETALGYKAVSQLSELSIFNVQLAGRAGHCVVKRASDVK